MKEYFIYLWEQKWWLLLSIGAMGFLVYYQEIILK